MAYAAVLSLKQTLEDYVLPFQLLNLEIMKMHVRDLCEKAYQVVRLFREKPVLPESRLDQLAKEIGPVVRTNTEDFMRAVGSDRVLKIMPRIFGFYPDMPKKSPIKKSDMLKEISDLKCELDSMNSHVDSFLRQTMFFYIWEDSSMSSARQCSKKLVNHLRTANGELEMAINFLQAVLDETISLRGKVCTLLRILKDTTDHEVVHRIKDVADRAEQSIQDCLIGNPVILEMKNFMESPPGEVHLETAAKNISDNVKVIHTWLEQTTREVSSRGPQFGNVSHGKRWLSESSEEEDDLSPKFISKRPRREPYGEKKDDVDIAFRNLHISSASQSSPLEQEEVVVGLEADTSKIIDELHRISLQLQTYRIVGMGGIGKTTLARKVFHHPSIVYHFHSLAWVDRVSKIDQVRDLLLNLLHSLAPSNDEIQGKTTEDLGENLRRILKGRRYLIVFDDLCNVEAWDAIKMYFPDENNGSRILITSRFTEFPTNANHRMRLLNEKQSWQLLEKLVHGKRSCPAELVDLGQEIAKKCGGLPLAIFVIAGTLSRIKRTRNCWRDVANGVKSIVCTDPQPCLDILAVSYNLLPHHLKACFLYMGVFPAYTEIPAWKLISLWIAEGFLDKESSNNLEDVAEGYLEDLIGRSLVLDIKRSFGGKIKTCLIHDLLRELCLREAQKANFMCVLETHAQGFPAGIDKQCRLVFNLDNCADLQLLPSIPHLRSFIWLILVLILYQVFLASNYQDLNY